jgi:orotate phosphoribosyltransferase
VVGAYELDEREKLIALIKAEALQFGEFRLASGKIGSFYLDCRKVSLHPQGANLVGAAMLKRIAQIQPPIDAVGGMAIGADPITAAIITLAGQQQIPLRGFIVRKEAKEHGTGKQVEGPVRPGQRVVIVEDVITSGGSALKAAEAAKQFGLEVVAVMAIVDRLQHGKETIAAAGLPAESLLTIEDLGIPSS